MQNDEFNHLSPKVISVRTHDPQAFTQGLALHENNLFESTGLYGQSTLRHVDALSGKVLRQINLPDTFFGEGIAVVRDNLIQLTWQEGVAFVYDLASFLRGELLYATSIPYEDEGWGLAFDGEYVYTSNGTNTIMKRNPKTLDVLDKITVEPNEDYPILINDMVCVDTKIVFNNYKTNDLLEIEKSSGKLLNVIRMPDLLTMYEVAGLGLLPYPIESSYFNSLDKRLYLMRVDKETYVLNGITHDPNRDTFLVTGKGWPKLFEISF